MIIIALNLIVGQGLSRPLKYTCAILLQRSESSYLDLVVRSLVNFEPCLCIGYKQVTQQVNFEVLEVYTYVINFLGLSLTCDTFEEHFCRIMLNSNPNYFRCICAVHIPLFHNPLA